MTKQIILGLALLLTACGGGGSQPTTPPPAQDSQAPTITLTSQTTFISTDEVMVDAQAFDNVGVSAVEFYLNGTLHQRVTAAPYRASFGKLAPGVYTVTAKALDQAGNTTTSTPTTITVSRAPTMLSGTIAQNTTLTAEQSPYLLTGDLIIAPGITLTINPGVEVSGSAQSYGFLPGITVHGTLLAVGTPSQPIKFNAIRIDPSGEVVNGAALTTFKHAVITNTEFLTLITSPSRTSTLTVEDSIIQYTQEFGSRTIGNFASGNVLLKGNIIRGAELYFTGNNEYTNNFISGDNDMLVYFNDTRPEFFNNTVIGKECSVVTAQPLFSDQKLTISIPPNYWGTTDINAIEQMIFDGKDDYGQRATAQFQSILSAPHPATPKP